MRKIELTAAVGGERLDVFIAREVAGLTRSAARRSIDEGLVTVDGLSQKAGYCLRGGEAVEVFLKTGDKAALKAESAALDILYEDDYILAVNKPRGVVVHPGAGNSEGTLAAAALGHTRGRLSRVGGEERPGIVHRLDKDTTGVLLIAKDDETHLALKGQFMAQSVLRKYVALVHGNIKEDSGRIDAPIGRNKADRKRMAVVSGARAAVSEFSVIKRFGRFTLVSCTLKTGRTHQIRVHMRHLGHPVLGDKKYGQKREPFALAGHLLHAEAVGFIHPKTEEYLEIKAPIPPEFEKILNVLEKTCGQAD